MKQIKFRSNLTAGIVSAAFGIAVIFLTPSQVGLGYDNSYGITPRTLPYVLAAVCVLFGALLIGQSLILKKDTVKTIEIGRELKALAYMAVFGAYAFLFSINFILATVFLGVATLLFLRCKKPLYYGIVVVTVAILYICLTQLLHIQLP